MYETTPISNAKAMSRSQLAEKAPTPATVDYLTRLHASLPLCSSRLLLRVAIRAGTIKFQKVLSQSIDETWAISCLTGFTPLLIFVIGDAMPAGIISMEPNAHDAAILRLAGVAELGDILA